MGTHTFRHSYRMWIDAIGTPIEVWFLWSLDAKGFEFEFLLQLASRFRCNLQSARLSGPFAVLAPSQPKAASASFLLTSFLFILALEALLRVSLINRNHRHNSLWLLDTAQTRTCCETGSAVQKRYKILGFNVSGWKDGAKEWLLR